MKEKDAKDRLTVDEIIEKEHLDKMNMKPSHRCSSFRDRWIRFGCTVKNILLLILVIKTINVSKDMRIFN